jgi:ADP-dependent NAD(P)H-hydrate dehydratase / NAD(P)H-hydrate epimerase
LPKNGRILADRLMLERVQAFLPLVITSEEMTCLEENAVNLGIPRQWLMENAGARVAEHIAQDPECQGAGALVVAGLGNNGGDGLVTARHLAGLGWAVDVVLLGRSRDLGSEEARTNWRILEELDLRIALHQWHDSSELSYLKELLPEHHVVVDAILGTGVRGRLREPVASAVRLINSSGKHTVAIDTPTGLDPSTGTVHGEAVAAATTITFHRNKKGFAQRDEYTGKVVVADIGIPLEAELYTGSGDVDQVTRPRTPLSRKGDNGYVLVIGGSEVYSGAPALAALAALRTGTGLALVAAPEAVSTAIRNVSPNIIVHPLPGKVVGIEHLDRIRELLPRFDSVILGPGIGLHPDTGRAVHAILEAANEAGLPIVVDADAIKALKDWPGAKGNAKVVLTPHAGEFKALTGIAVEEEGADRIEVADRFAKDHGCVLLLKGHRTTIADGRRLKINRTGNPAMATGGSGDVLSGIIGAYLAQGQDPFRSAAAGAFINGQAGDLARQAKGYHIVASDLVEMIPEVLRPFDKGG